jgi:hypothetical protein
MTYLEQHNAAPKPFIWTAPADPMRMRCRPISSSGIGALPWDREIVVAQQFSQSPRPDALQ